MWLNFKKNHNGGFILNPMPKAPFVLVFAGVLTALMGWAGIAWAAPGDILWEAVYSSRPDNDNDRAAGLALDSKGGLIVAGSRAERDGNYDYLTIKYGPYGKTDWVVTYDHSWYDVGRAVAADQAGNTVVAGASYNLDNPRDTYSGAYYTDYRIVTYDPAGKPLSEMAASGYRKDNDPAAVDVDAKGGIYVTGTAMNAPGVYPMYYTVKFEPDGSVGWEKIEDWVTESYATGLRLDGDGSVLVTGYTMNPVTGNYDTRTLRYSPDGASVLMDVSYNELYYDEKAHGLAIDDQGNIIVTGESNMDDGVTLTLKYSPKGELLWAVPYRGSEYRNRGNSVAVDGQGLIYVAGRTFKENQEGDFLLLVYGRDGRLLDSRTYDFENGGDDDAEAVAVDAYGNVVIAGTTRAVEKPTVFRTIRVEGFPLNPDAKGPAAEDILDGGRKITLCSPPAPMIRTVSLTAERSGSGAVVSLVADPVSLPVDCEYRFFVMGRNSAHHWEAVGDYTGRNIMVLAPSGTQGSPDRVMVQVRTKGSGLVYEAQAVLGLNSIH